MKHVVVGFAALGMLALNTSSSGQELLFRWNGGADSDRLGVELDAAGDVDQDGIPDVILGAHHHDPGGLFNAGCASVRSGADGAELWLFTGDEEELELGIGVAGIGDVDADGHGDLAIGARGTALERGRVDWRSGRTGELLFQFFGAGPEDAFGGFLAGVGDVDRDGIPDCAVGVPKDDTAGSDAGAVYVFSGQDGSLIHAFFGESNQASFGQSVASIGDLDLDGFADILTGAPHEDHGADRTGSAYVFSGDGGALLLRVDGEQAVDVLGTSVAGLGDITDDGVPDFATGAPNADGNRGLALVHSGADGSVVHRIRGGVRSSHLGVALAGVGDANQDGVADLLVADDQFADDDRGRVSLVSGLGGEALYRWQGGHAEQRLGNDLAGVGDMDGDGFPDLLLAAQHDDSNGSSSGSAFVYRGNDLFLQFSPRSPRAGDDIEFVAREAPAGAQVALYLVEADGLLVFLQLAAGQFDADREWVHSQTIPPGFSGLEMVVRCFACKNPLQHSGVIDSAPTRIVIR